MKPLTATFRRPTVAKCHHLFLASPKKFIQIPVSLRGPSLQHQRLNLLQTPSSTFCGLSFRFLSKYGFTSAIKQTNSLSPTKTRSFTTSKLPTSTKGSSSSSSSSSTKDPPKSESFTELLGLITTIAIRIAAGISIAHLIDEYGFCVTLCEGPSMMPTIYPKGEIILVERISHRIFGLDGGCSGEKRVQTMRERQSAWEKEKALEYQKAELDSAQKNKKDNNDETSEEEENWMVTWHQIPKKSNVSTGDKLIEKFSTGVHVGDVVVVQHPFKDGTVCKRVIGLPGDIIINHGQQEYDRRRDKLFVVPDGQIWIEGDNTPNSSDSRVYGSVPASLIVGKVVCRIWPIRGDACMDRGVRPVPPKGSLYTGSMMIPAGYEGETIVKMEEVGR